MGEYNYERLRKIEISKGSPRCIYEPIGEELPSREIWAELPNFYKAHVLEKNEMVSSLLAKIPNKECFVFFSDCHVRQNRMLSVPILRSILKNTDIDKVIYGGDTVSAWVNEKTMVEDVIFFNDAFAFAKPYIVRGNHDLYGKEFWIANEGALMNSTDASSYLFRDMKDRVIIEEGKTYYYFDCEKTKTRFIVIDTNEHLSPVYDSDGLWDCTVRVSSEQLDWFADRLSDMKDGYDAVVIGHIPFFEQLRHHYDGALPFGDIVSAFNSKETLSKAVRLGDSEYEMRYDFSSTSGRVIATFCGHGHCDDAFVSEDGCVNIEIHCDAPGTDNGGSTYKKCYGTVDESSLDAVIIDRDTNRVYTVRYGCGIDREF